MSALLTLSGVETHIGHYHILHGVELDVPEGRTTMLLGRNGAGKTTTLRTIMGLWRASRRRDPPRRRADRGARHARHRARRHRLCAGDHGGVLRPDGEGEPGARGARRRDGPDTPRLDFRLLPAAEEVLAVARRNAVGRAEADALVRARLHRAAPAAADRRADQGARARDHRRAGRMPRRGEAARRHHPAGRAEFSRRAGDRRHGQRDGQWPRRAYRHDGGARAATRRCSTDCSGSAWIRINERAGQRGRRRRRAAKGARRLSAAAAAAAARGRRLAVHSVGLDLGDADHRGARDGHDDLRDGVGPHADLRPDGRAQFRPRRLHRDRRLSGDAGAGPARRLDAGGIRSGSISRPSFRRCCSRPA